MSLFVLDTAGDKDLLKKNVSINAKHLGKNSKRSYLDVKEATNTSTVVSDVEENDEGEDNNDFFGLPPPSVDLSKIINSTLEQTERHKTKNEVELEALAEKVDSICKNGKKKKKHPRHKFFLNAKCTDFNELTGKFDDEEIFKPNVEKELSESNIPEGLENVKGLPRFSKDKQRILNRIERAKTKGADWYDLPATELTNEVKADLRILQMRSVLNPKHFYKKNDLKVLPKYFQIGTVLHSPLDYYNERGTRKNKKRSLVDEIMADTDVLKYTKRKYQEIVARNDKYAHRKAMRKMKKLKKNK